MKSDVLREGYKKGLREALSVINEMLESADDVKRQRDELAKEMERCIENWLNGGTAVAEIDGRKFCTHEDFLQGYCGDFSLKEVVDSFGIPRIAREWADAAFDD